LADKRRAARIAVLVGGGCVEVGGWSPEAGRGSGQLKVGLLVLGLAREQRCNAPVRTESRSWTSLTTTARTLSWSWSFMRLALVLAALADL